MNEKTNIKTISNLDYEELIKKTFSFEKNKENSVVEGKVISIDKNNVIIDVSDFSIIFFIHFKFFINVAPRIGS